MIFFEAKCESVAEIVLATTKLERKQENKVC